MQQIILIVAVALFTCAMFGETRSNNSLVRGTINVAIANKNGAVILTDSMLTEITTDKQGARAERQRPEPGQKLFQLDEQTVCTFAGFASASTPPLPDFLNGVPSIMGRVKEKLSRADHPLTVQEKLQALSAIFHYYISGIATLRKNLGDDYTFEMLIAGYDPDGLLKIGKLKMALEILTTVNGTTFEVMPVEQRVQSLNGKTDMLFAGIEDVAENIKDYPDRWNKYEQVNRYALSEDKGPELKIGEMRSLAIFMKEQTASKYKEVGGPSQIAILNAGKVQVPIEQPEFAPVQPAKFKFLIVSGVNAQGEQPNMVDSYYGVVAPDCYPLFFDNKFTSVRQELGDAYYSGNTFVNSALSYQGGKVGFENNNQVIDSDLLIGPRVRSDSPEVKELLKNFKWRHVNHVGFPTKASAGMFLGCFDTKHM